MYKKKFVTSVITALTLVFGALFFSPFFVHVVSTPEVKAVSEQPGYIPTNYTNIGTPISAIVLSDGNIWYADQQNGRIIKVNQDGDVLRTVGRYGTNEGEFDGELSGIATDNDGNLYVQTFNHTYKLDFNGGYLKSWGQQGNNDEDYANPSAIHYDTFSDSLFIADTINNSVKKYTKDGVYISKFGSAGTGDGEFSHPTSVATDTDGRIYVSDGDHGRVEVFNNAGVFQFAFASQGDGDNELNAPQGIAIKSNGNIVVSSQNSHKMQVFSSNGTWISSWGEQGNSAWQFQAPRSLSQDTSGNIYVTDWSLKSIQKFTSSGVFVSAIRNSGYVSGKLTAPSAVAYDSVGNVYVLDSGTRVQKFTNAGTYITTVIDTPILGAAAYNMIIHNDQLYITQEDGFRKFDLSGNETLSALSGGTGDGQFSGARGIGVDSTGNIYVADLTNHRVQKFDSSGNYLTQWGTKGTGDSQFGQPEILVVDSSDDIYVGDGQYYISDEDFIENNTRIQVFDTDGVYQRTIGTFGDADGQLFRIGGMAFDADGKLHVSDSYYNKIQVFNTNGTFSRKYSDSGVGGGSGVDQVFEPLNLALNPITDNISIVDSQNHRVQLVPSGTRIFNLINSADVLSSSDNNSLVYRYYDPQSSGVDSISSRLYFGDYIVSDFSVNLASDRDWQNVNVLTLPNESKSLVVNLNPTTAPGISASHSLYIIKQDGQTTVHVCPSAVVLSDISADCTDGYDLEDGSASLTTVTLAGKTYWKVTGLTGTGIMSEVSDVTPTPTPTATGTGTATPTATTTVTTTTTGTSTPTPVHTGTTTPKPTTPIIAAVTLPPAVKGETPVCPTFTSFTTSSTLVKRGDSVKFAWATKNTEAVRTALTEKDLPALGEYTITPDQTTSVTFIADNGFCTAKKSATVVVVETLPWTNTITVGAGLLLVEAALAATQPAMFGNLWLAIAGFFSKKKRQTWGVVYNAATKRPLGRVVIRLLHADKTVADTTVSEANGTFQLTPKIGKFTVTAALAGFSFPSKLITSEVDGGYNNIYHGQEINITETSNGILLSIPMDVTSLSDTEKKRVATKNVMSEVVEIGSNLMMFAGFGYGVYVAYLYPHIYNYAILLAYLLLVLSKLYLILPRKTVGTVTLPDKTPVADIEIGLFDTEFKNLLYRTFTNEYGEYSFVVPNNTYNLKIMDERYRIAIKGQLAKGIQLESKGSNTVRVITNDLTLE